MAINWEGVFCALWTPTDSEGALLKRELRENIQFLQDRGIRGLLALGSTGEFLHLDLPQRKAFLECVRAEAGDLPVIANISDVRAAAMAELAHFAKLTGCAAVALLPPYFYPVAQADLVEFFARAGEAAQLPLFLYNFPERTGNRIALETVAAVAERAHLAGVKQSGAEFEYHARLVELGRAKNFVVLTGSDTRLPEAMAMGVAGCVSGLSNAVPEPIVEIFEACRAGEPQRAALAIERMRRIGEHVERLEFPLNVAAIMEARGRPVGHPKSCVSPATRARYQQLVAALRGLLADWESQR